MNTTQKKRGGDVKRAPSGYYTAKQAQEKLGLNPSTFSLYVRQGKIKRHIPPLRKEGYYSRKEIDKLATKWELFLSDEAEKTAETRVATEKDVQGIVDVLTSFGWQAATAEQRLSWYKSNPYIDYVVLWDGKVMGYIWAAPFTNEALGAMMSGKKRAWNIIPQDILPYESGKKYDLYVGVATRKDAPHHTHLSSHLIASFMGFLEELAEKGITIRRMFAVSAEPDGQKLCKRIGFIEQQAEQGDMFPRFILDFEASDSRLAKLYREAVHAIQQERD